MIQASIFAATAFLVWAIVYYAHWVLLRRRFVAIAAGRVYQSGAMYPSLLIRYARRYSITTVIDFRGENENGVCAERQALAEAGVRHVNIPVGILPTRDSLRRFIEVMREDLQDGKRVLMHCKDGQGRAIAFAAIYRIEFEGWDPVQAYRGTSRLPPGLRPISLLFPGAGLLSPRNAKTQFILNYRSSQRLQDAPESIYVGETGV